MIRLVPLVCGCQPPIGCKNVRHGPDGVVALQPWMGRSTAGGAIWGPRKMKVGARPWTSPLPWRNRGGGDIAIPGVAVGRSHTCVVLATGEVWCWGYNDFGQLGSGESSDGCHQTPELVANVGDAVGICAYDGGSCVVTEGGEVVCWGREFKSYGVPHPPSALSGLSGVIALGCGSHHACALVESGDVWCWGANVVGQLGVQGIEESEVPVMVPGLN